MEIGCNQQIFKSLVCIMIYFFEISYLAHNALGMVPLKLINNVILDLEILMHEG